MNCISVCSYRISSNCSFWASFFLFVFLDFFFFFGFSSYSSLSDCFFFFGFLDFFFGFCYSSYMFNIACNLSSSINVLCILFLLLSIDIVSSLLSYNYPNTLLFSWFLLLLLGYCFLFFYSVFLFFSFNFINNIVYFISL